MSGVTNQLVAAANLSGAGNETAAREIFSDLRRKHIAAAHELIHSDPERARLEDKIEKLLEAGELLCQETAMLRELTPQVRDAICGLGERLSILLVTAALSERGIASEAIEATGLIVTKDCHGRAEPCMQTTRQLSRQRLLPLLREGVFPVVTGFIAATVDGVPTTLGRGGSDYSATILGAVLDASAVVIWTDVDGLHTADPRLVPEARSVPAVSYREAAELAFFGAKVLHPKTLSPVMQCGIPLWIRNTFAPQNAGTKITPRALPGRVGITALTSTSDVALITVSGSALLRSPNGLYRVSRAMAAIESDILMMAQMTSSQNDLFLVLPLGMAETARQNLRRELAYGLTRQLAESVVINPEVALLTVVGSLRSIRGILSLASEALAAENISILAQEQGQSENTLSLVIEKKDIATALRILHREFGLSSRTPLTDNESVQNDYSSLCYPIQTCQTANQKS
jgi:aspartate kinase